MNGSGNVLVVLGEDVTVAADHVDQVFVGGLIGEVLGMGVEHFSPGLQPIHVGGHRVDHVAVGVGAIALVNELAGSAKIPALFRLGVLPPIVEVHDAAVAIDVQWE